ncbi:hypothetical protein [Kineococcus terrestris]|uniref:hypothetical protein n=1 Tax=Kineococcus terrestris TaxID=2044856 RepID=UPI0034DB0030
MNDRPAGALPGEDVLAAAARSLRVHTPAGWTTARAGVLERARRAFRPSAPVRGRHELGEFVVAADVVVLRLRQAVDALPDTAARRITCATDATDALDGVTVEVAVLFGAHLPTAARTVRAVVVRRLEELLGELSPVPDAVDVHVHVGDVVADVRDLR